MQPHQQQQQSSGKKPAFRIKNKTPVLPTAQVTLQTFSNDNQKNGQQANEQQEGGHRGQQIMNNQSPEQTVVQQNNYQYARGFINTNNKSISPLSKLPNYQQQQHPLIRPSSLIQNNKQAIFTQQNNTQNKLENSNNYSLSMIIGGPLTMRKQESIEQINQQHRNMIEQIITRTASMKIQKRNSLSYQFNLPSKNPLNPISSHQEISQLTGSIGKNDHLNNTSYLAASAQKLQLSSQQKSTNPFSQDLTPTRASVLGDTKTSRNQTRILKNLSAMVGNTADDNILSQVQVSKPDSQNYSQTKKSPNLSPRYNMKDMDIYHQQQQQNQMGTRKVADKNKLSILQQQQNSQVDSKFKEFFVLNKNQQDKHQQKLSMKKTSIADFSSNSQSNFSNRGGGFNKNNNNNTESKTSRTVMQTSQRHRDGFMESTNPFINPVGLNRDTAKSTDKFKKRTLGSRLNTTNNKESFFDPDALERDDYLRYRNIEFYEKILKATSSQHHRAKSASGDYENSQEIQELIEDMGNFFFLGKDCQKTMEKQLIRLRKFNIDFTLTKKTIGDAIANFFVVSDKNRSDLDMMERREQEEREFDSQEPKSYQKRQQRQLLLFEKQKRFDALKRKVEGLTYSLQSYTKDIMKNNFNMKQEESLKKRSGLLDFLGELNDCEKNLIRWMGELCTENCFPMYALDFLWKLMLIRIEYHLDDEEQRITKVKKFYDSQLKKEIAEIQYSIQNKEENYRDVINKLERTRDNQQSRIEKLMQDKGQLMEALRDKQDELQFLRNPHGVGKFGNLNQELEAYIESMHDKSNEKIRALQEMKIFMDTLAQKQPNWDLLHSKAAGIDPNQQSKQPVLIMQTPQEIEISKQQSKIDYSSQFSPPIYNKDMTDVISMRSHNINKLASPQEVQFDQNGADSDRIDEMTLVKLNKSKALPILKAFDDSLLAPQLQQAQNQSLKTMNKQQPHLYDQISSQQYVLIKRTRDQHAQTEIDEDFICSKCLIQADQEQQEEEELFFLGAKDKKQKGNRQDNSQNDQDNSFNQINEASDLNQSMKSRKSSQGRRDDMMKVSKIVENQRLSMLRSKSILRSTVNTNNNNATRMSTAYLNSSQPMFQMQDTSNRLTLADQLNHESKEIIMMPEQTLLKQIEDLLEKKFEHDEAFTQALRQSQIIQQNQLSGHSSYNRNQAQQNLASQQSTFASMQNQLNSQQDILQFVYTHFLTTQGLKSLALRYLNSLYSGLRKIYMKSPAENLYAQFLMQIFGFNPSEFPAFRPDQTKIALKVRHLFQIVHKSQTQKSQSLQPLQQNQRMKLNLTNGGLVQLLEFIPFLFKACKNNPKGVFSNFINGISITELQYEDKGVYNQSQIQKHFVNMKILLLLSHSRIDMHNIAMKTDERELQMDVVLMHLEETLDIKLNKKEVTAFKKGFDNFYLVPLKLLEAKVYFYTQMISAFTPQDPNQPSSHAPGGTTLQNLDFQISLLMLMNKFLEEWDTYQVQLKKKLLKKFIDFDANGDGVLTLDEFRDLMRSLEGPAVNNERVVMLFKEAVELSNEQEQLRMQSEFDGGDGAGFGKDINIRRKDQKGGLNNSDKISPECFVETVIKHKLGGYGSNEFLDFEFVNQQNQDQQKQLQKPYQQQ